MKLQEILKDWEVTFRGAVDTYEFKDDAELIEYMIENLKGKINYIFTQKEDRILYKEFLNRFLAIQ